MTTTDLAVRNGTIPAHQQAALAIKPGQTTWDKYQEAALAQIGLKNAPNADRAVFLHVCQRTGLDPFSRQIYMIERREKVQGSRDEWTSKWTIQTGIDGYRVNRARAERQAGVRGTLSRAVFYDWDGGEHKAWVRPEPPAACEITYTVRDADGTETPYTSVLRYDEYVQTRNDGNGQRVPSGQWATKPAHMLEKCTEADVYRKAFPQDFSGVHLDDAMSPADGAEVFPDRRPRVTASQARERVQRVRSQVVPPEDAPWPGDAAPAQPEPEQPAGDPRDRIRTALAALGIGSSAAVADYVTQLTGVNASADLSNITGEQAGDVLRALADVTTRKQLDALLATGEAPGDGE